MFDLLVFTFGSIFSFIVLVVLLGCVLVNKEQEEESESDKLRRFMNEYQKYVNKEN
jgi:hypothetical protein